MRLVEAVEQFVALLLVAFGQIETYLLWLLGSLAEAILNLGLG